jgi:hypothetical protein
MRRLLRPASLLAAAWLSFVCFGSSTAAPVVDLGGKTTIPETAWVSVRPELDQLPFKPFTEADVKKLVGPRVVTEAGQTVVRNLKGKKAPIDQYLKEINGVEQFLCDRGFTLREVPGEKQSNRAGRKVYELGRVVQLGPHPKTTLGKITVYQDPNRLAKLLKILKDGPDPIDEGKLFPAKGRPELLKMRRRPLQSVARLVREPYRATVVRADGLIRETVALRPGSDARFLRLPQPGGLDGMTRYIYTPLSPCQYPSSPPGGSVSLGEPAKEGIDPSGKPQGSAKAENVTGGGTKNGEKKPGVKYAGCLYDGQLCSSWDGPSFTSTAGSEWFGVSLAGILNAAANYENKSLHCQSSAGIVLDAKILGLSFPLLEYSMAGTADGGGFQPDKAFTVPFTGFSDSGELFKQQFEGPQAHFAIGPVPCSIRSGLNAELGITSLKNAYVAPPLSCVPGTGTLSVGAGIHARCDVFVKAGVDAVFVSAGAKGTLVLAEDTFGASLVTSITPVKNEVKVAPAFQYSVTHLNGNLALFFEVDLGFYSKEFVFELVSWPGFHDEGTHPLEAGYFAARA